MSDFTDDDVRNLARLAKIRVSDDELETLKKELSSIRAHVDQIQSADTEGIEITIQSNGVANVERADEIVEAENARILDGVPKTMGTYIKVPKVL